jgi:hypothetical protein
MEAVLWADGRTKALGLGPGCGLRAGREQDDVVVEVCGGVNCDCSVLDDGELDSGVPE